MRVGDEFRSDAARRERRVPFCEQSGTHCMVVSAEGRATRPGPPARFSKTARRGAPPFILLLSPANPRYIYSPETLPPRLTVVNSEQLCICALGTLAAGWCLIVSAIHADSVGVPHV